MISLGLIIYNESKGGEDLNQSKQKRKPKLLIWIIPIILLIWIIIYFFPVKKHTTPAYFDHEKLLVIAHQGGEHLAPSSTLEAFRNAQELGVDVIEFDIHMTKDEYLVAIHDPTVDRTTSGTGVVNEMTLEEVQSLDAGMYFKDLDGDYSYRGQGVYIPTVEEIFEEIPHMYWNVEIKDTNDPTLYRTIAEKLWDAIQQHKLEEQVLFAAFDQEIIDIVLDVTNGEALVSGGRGEVTKFVILHKLFLNGLYRPQVNALQIPTEDSRINLKDQKLIRGARKKGMEVHYWTINDPETMQELIDLGADGIITDRPDLLIELLKE